MLSIYKYPGYHPLVADLVVLHLNRPVTIPVCWSRMQALRSARLKVESALDEYAQACLTLANYSGFRPAINSLQDLTDEVNSEVEAFTSIKDKTKRVEATINKARNSLFSLVPINSLPDEVLVRIFRLAMKAQSLNFEKVVDAGLLPVNALAVSQVCARWRRVSLCSRSLWSHLDLSIRNEVVSLGHIFASRSVDQPLSIRVIEPLTRWSLSDFPIELYDLMTSVGSSIESLEFAWTQPPPHDEFTRLWFDVLQYSIVCATERLTRLVISDRKVYTSYTQYYNSAVHWFIVVEDRDEPDPPVTETGLSIIIDDISKQHYEHILSGVTVLCLDRVYPLWSSKAYHGLVELRLVGPPRLTAIITTVELAGILAASPALRILHLGVEVRLTEVLPPSIHLVDLEVFLLQSLSYTTQEAILRLILPGSKPLQMSMAYGEGIAELPAAGGDEFCNFFQRSNLVGLQVHSQARVLPELLFYRLPTLHTLILRDVCILADDTSVSSPKLSALHLMSCSTNLESLVWLISGRNIREVTIWQCKVFEQDSYDDVPVTDFRSELMEVCPCIRFLGTSDDEQNPKIEGWGEDIQERMRFAQKNDYRVEYS